MTSNDLERNLLIALLANRLDFITLDQMFSVIADWSNTKSEPIDVTLMQRTMVDEESRDVLIAAVDKHIALHGDDPKRSFRVACPVDSEVYRKVRSISGTVLNDTIDATLDSSPQDRIVDTVDSASDKPTIEESSTPQSPQHVRYEKLRNHARGGLGLVSVALDHELKREVALKEIQDRFADDVRSRARFVLEAEVTGRLEHPGVVPIYGLGTNSEGRPYYAMRFIRGDSLLKAIDRLHETRNKLGQATTTPFDTTRATEKPVEDSAQQTSDPQRFSIDHRALEFRKLLKRFVDVCSAIEYAHSRGVLHRDIKPANIMLGDFGETLVVDWGIAKLIDESKDNSNDKDGNSVRSSSALGDQTEQGSIVGTLAYMSPEQARGELEFLGPESDVFSLGATFYHLLVGKPPIRKTGDKEALDLVKNGEFVAPREIQPSIPRPLEAICLKAMASTRSERYSSSASLAEDLERWFADEPISAYRESPIGRAQRWLRKRPGVAASTAVSVALLLLFFAAGFGLVSNYNQQLGQAYAAESESRELAEANFDTARDAVQEYLTLVSDSPKLKEADFHDLRIELLETAVPFIQQLIDRKPGDTSVEIARADALYRLADIRKTTGDAKRARELYERAIAAYDELSRDHSNEKYYQIELAKTHNEIGTVHLSLGSTEEAEQSYKRSKRKYEELLRRTPNDPTILNQLTKTENNLGTLYRDLGDRERALETFEATVRRQAKLVHDHPEVADYQFDFAKHHMNIGVVQQELGNLVGSQENYDQAFSILQRLTEEYPTEALYEDSLASTYSRLGILIRETADYERAKQLVQESLNIRIGLADRFPRVSEYQRLLALTHNEMAAVLTDLNLESEAIQHYRSALQVSEALVTLHPEVPEFVSDGAVAHLNIGIAMRKSGQIDESIDEFDLAVSILNELATEFPEIADFRSAAATAHRSRGSTLRLLIRRSEAKTEYDQAAKIFDDLIDRFPNVASYRESQADLWQERAALAAEQQDYESALSSFATSVELYQSLVNDFPTIPDYRATIANTHRNIGSLQRRIGQPGEALASLEEAAKVQQALSLEYDHVPDYREDLAAIQNSLAIMYVNLNSLDIAEELLISSLENRQRNSSEFPEVVDFRRGLSESYASLGNICSMLGRPGDAMKHYQAGHEIINELVDQFPEVADYAIALGAAQCNIGMQLKKQPNEIDDAIDWLADAIETLDAVVAKDPLSTQGRSFLINARRSRADAFKGQANYGPAAADYLELMELSSEEQKTVFQIQVAYCQAKNGDVSDAIITADQLVESTNRQMPVVFLAARIYSESAKHEENQSRSNELKEIALELLGEAVANGVLDSPQAVNLIMVDTMFDAIRDDERYPQTDDSP